MGLYDIYTQVPPSFQGQNRDMTMGAFNSAPQLYSQWQQQRTVNESRMAPENIRGDFASAITRVLNGEDPTQVAREHKQNMLAPQQAQPQAMYMPPGNMVQQLPQNLGPQSYQSYQSGNYYGDAPEVQPETRTLDFGGNRQPLPASRQFAMERAAAQEEAQAQQEQASRGIPTPTTPAEWELALRAGAMKQQQRAMAMRPQGYDRFELERLRQQGRERLQEGEQEFKGGEGEKERAIKEDRAAFEKEYKNKYLSYLWASMRERASMLEKKLEQSGIENKIIVAKIGALGKVLASDIPAGMNPAQVEKMIQDYSADIDAAETELGKTSTKKKEVKASSKSTPKYEVGKVYDFGGRKGIFQGYDADGTILAKPVK